MNSYDFISNLPLVYSLTAILGLVFGSFLTVVIYRTPIMLKKEWRTECLDYLALPAEEQEKFSLIQPRSHCPHCKTPIKIRHNIPLLGYLIQGGKCFHCKTAISLRYPLIELLCATLSVLTLMRFGVSWQTLAALCFTYSLVALFFIDLDTKLLPDIITLSTLWIGLILNSTTLFTPLKLAVLSAASAYLFLWSLTKIFAQIRGRQGMGHGDFKMMAMVGAWFGFDAMISTLVISTVLGAFCGLISIFTKKSDWGSSFPFGPYIAIGAWISMMTGPSLLTLLFTIG